MKLKVFVLAVVMALVVGCGPTTQSTPTPSPKVAPSPSPVVVLGVPEPVVGSAGYCANLFLYALETGAFPGGSPYACIAESYRVEAFTNYGWNDDTSLRDFIKTAGVTVVAYKGNPVLDSKGSHYYYYVNNRYSIEVVLDENGKITNIG